MRLAEQCVRTSARNRDEVSSYEQDIGTSRRVLLPAGRSSSLDLRMALATPVGVVQHNQS